MTHVYQPHAGGFAYFTSGVINGAIGVGGTWTAYSTLTLPAYTLGGTVTSNGQSFSGTIANLGTVTTVDLNGGTIDGTIIGGAVPAAGTFTTAAATTGNITTVNATTVDTTNIEVTNLKAKDGTAAGSIADATGVVTLGSSVLTTTDINGGTIDGVALGGASAVSLGTPSSGTLTNCTGLPVSTGISGLAANVATFLATPSSANLASAVTDETGSGALVFATSPSFTTPTINTAASVGGSWTAAAAWTLPAFTLGGTVTSNGQSFSGTIANLGTVTTADINGGTIDGAVIGGASAAAGTFTDLTTTGNTTLGNASTDTLNVGNGGIIKDASGNVGIGVTPAAKLHAAGANTTVGSNDALVQFRTTTAQAADVGASLQLGGMYDGSNSLGFAEISGRKENSTSGEWGGYLQLSTRQYGGSFAERMRITSAGNVGIGTTPARGRLEVLQSSDAVAGGIALVNSGVTVSYRYWIDGSGLLNLTDGASANILKYNAGTGLLNLGNGSTFHLTTAGNVGIGVTPSYKLHVGSGQIAAPDGSAAAPSYSFASSGNSDNGMYLSANNVVSVAIAGAKTATIKADRLEFASGYHVTSATATGTTPALQSGTYTPGLTSITNVFGTPAAQASQWMRVGNVVTVSGIIEVEPASSASDTVVAVSLPIASSLTADEHLSGTAGSQLDARYGGCVYGAPASDTAYVRFYGVASSTHPVCYHFTYVVL